MPEKTNFIDFMTLDSLNKKYSFIIKSDQEKYLYLTKRRMLVENIIKEYRPHFIVVENCSKTVIFSVEYTEENKPKIRTFINTLIEKEQS